MSESTLKERVYYKFWTFVEWIDSTLDAIPTYEGGKWYRYGDWGCRSGLPKLWEPRLYK